MWQDQQHNIHTNYNETQVNYLTETSEKSNGAQAESCS